MSGPVKYTDLTQRELLDNFEVDFDQGRLFWKPPTQGGRITGKEAGTLYSNGYWKIEYQGIRYQRARLIFLAAYGRWPKQCIDHINNIRNDDRLCNLREATACENAQNRQSKNEFRGTCYVKKRGTYGAAITANKKRFFLGEFATREEAAATYRKAREKYFGEFA